MYVIAAITRSPEQKHTKQNRKYNMQPSTIHLLKRIEELKQIEPKSKEQSAKLIELAAEAKALGYEVEVKETKKSSKKAKVDKLPVDDEQQEDNTQL